MRVQWKLFVILFGVGVVPLVLVASVSLCGVGQFGRELASEMERELTLMVSAQVEQDAATASDAVARGTGASRIALRVLALKTEQLLAQTITTLPKVYFSEDYDTLGNSAPRLTYPPGYTRLATDRANKREVSQAVSFDDLVFVTAPGVSREQVRGDIARLARLLPSCQNLFRDLGGSAYRVFVCLQSGITAAYPGFGGYPSDFDPRLSSWYRRASQSSGSPVWSELLISRSTGMALFSFTMPVRAPDGSFAGVASVELPLTWFLQETELASAWTKKMHSFLVSAQEGASKGRAELHILARRDYSGRTTKVESYEHLGGSDDSRAFQTLANDILAGGAGASRLRFEGEDSIWAYAPLAREGMAFLLVVPVSVASAGVERLLDQVEDRVSVQWLVTYAATVILVFIAALVAYLASRRGVHDAGA